MIADIDKRGVKRGKVDTITKDMIWRKAISMMNINKCGVIRGKVDTFTKDIIWRNAISMMNINKCVSLRTLKEELKEKDVKIRTLMSMNQNFAMENLWNGTKMGI